jgi:hypothetical protein
MGSRLSGNFNRRIGTRPRVGDHFAIDIQEWQRSRTLDGHTHFVSLNLGLRLEIDTHHHAVDVRVIGQFPHSRRQRINIRWGSGLPGASRAWLTCPNNRCSRSCRYLYYQDGFFCRRCLGLKYPSQSHSKIQRLFDEYVRIDERIRLVEGDSVRPKGMHTTTYEPLARRGKVLYRYLFGPSLRAFDRIAEIDRMSASAPSYARGRKSNRAHQFK